MMGKDCEHILASINGVKDSLASCIVALSGAINTRIETEGHHDELEKESPIDVNTSLSGINVKLSVLKGDLSKMYALEKKMYTSATKFNNSYGSPWKEMHMLDDAINRLLDLDTTNSKYLGGKIALLQLMNMALARAVDAKWAITFYNDYIQRGYDTVYNKNKPSITFNEGLNRETIGNGVQDYTENVNVQKKSIDPY